MRPTTNAGGISSCHISLARACVLLVSAFFLSFSLCLSVVAAALRTEMKAELDALRVSQGDAAVCVTLAVVMVGLRKDSQTYVRMKTKACAEVGIHPAQYDLPAESTQEELLALIRKLNADPSTHGILVQLPLPAHIHADTVLEAIHPAKDVDGLTITNAGDLLRNGHKAHLIPCTPLGCIALLDHYKFDIAGKHAVVVGRSALVGKPVAQLLLSRDATVTMCHSKTKNLEEMVRSADIVIAAIGRAATLKGSVASHVDQQQAQTQSVNVRRS